MQERLERLHYPCYLIVHAPERNWRTRSRPECPGAFAKDMVYNLQEALEVVKRADYHGPDSEVSLTSIRIYVDETDGPQLVETDV